MTKYERYKDVPHFDLVRENDTISIPSIFIFQGGCLELFSFLRACEEYNCTVLFENEDILVKPNEKSATQSVVLSIYAMIAEKPKIAEDYIRYLSLKMERENIIARTSGGRKVKASRGGYSGGRTPYGYKVDKNIKGMVINEEQAQVVRLIYEMKQSGATFQRIVDELNNQGYTNKSGGKWSISSVQVILDNEKTYRGMYKYGENGEWVKGQHEAILK